MATVMSPNSQMRKMKQGEVKVLNVPPRRRQSEFEFGQFDSRAERLITPPWSVCEKHK